MTKKESAFEMEWFERLRQKYLASQRRAKRVPYRRIEPKWGIKGTGIYFKKHGKRVFKYNRDTGAVEVFRRRDMRPLENSPHNRRAS